MSDYNFDVDVLRGKMANELAGNIEQFAFVLTNALSHVAADDVIDAGEMGDEADPELVVHNLRSIANAIEAGSLT
ncbi:hypothetical protein [Roseobacter sp. N2S]|uniref:hypothetical protein n=1 Tax=Roseobacter sp. N2S TaxID=2663844 RepID=UPI002860947E|nr:hypothetical protein [Roseobacter sp. N2S]MDR6266570.1 hypothetical protein [Roseobacter sp. N2S]